MDVEGTCVLWWWLSLSMHSAKGQYRADAAVCTNVYVYKSCHSETKKPRT